MILNNIIKLRERILESVRRAYHTFYDAIFGRSYFRSLSFTNNRGGNLEGLINNYFDRRAHDAFDYDSIRSRFDVNIISPNYIRLTRKGR